MKPAVLGSFGFLLQPAGLSASRGRLGYVDGGLGLGFSWDGGSHSWDGSIQLSGGWEGGDRNGGVQLVFSSGSGGGSHGDQRLHELFLIPELVEIGDASLQLSDGAAVAEDGLGQLVAAITPGW